MSDTTKALKTAWQDLEAAAIALQNEKDQAIEKLRAKYAKRQRAAVDKAAQAQKAYLDAEAVEGLLSDPARTDEERAAVAAAVGLELPK